MIERSAAFRDGGLIDITFDEANPPFTYTGNSFDNANAYGPTRKDQPEREDGDQGRRGRREHLRHERALGADRRELDARDRREGRPALSRPREQRVHRPARRLHDDLADADPGGVRARHRPRRLRHDARCADRRGHGLDRIDVRRGPVRRGDRHRAPGHRHRRHHRSRRRRARSRRTPSSARSATPAPSSRRRARDRSSNGSLPAGRPGRQPGAPDRRGDLPHPERGGAARAPHRRPDAGPAVRRQGSDARRRRHRQRADQPVHQAGDVDDPVLRPLQLAADDGGHLPGRAAVDDHAALPAGTVSGGLDREGHLGFAATPGLAPFGRDVFNNASRKHS